MERKPAAGQRPYSTRHSAGAERQRGGTVGTLAACVTPSDGTGTGDSPLPHSILELNKQEEESKYITLYRGVANNSMVEDPLYNNSFQYETALLGMAIPRGWGKQGSHSDLTDHMFGDTHSSNLTSWSTKRSVAEGFATQGAPGGVVLSKEFPRSVLYSIYGHSTPKPGEHEVPIFGIVTGAHPEIQKSRIPYRLR